MTLATTAALIGAAFLFLYFAFNLPKGSEGENTHFFLKILLFGFFISTLMLIGKDATDNANDCQLLINSTTASAPDTFYTYETVCLSTPYNTANRFYDLLTWFMRVFILYFFIYLVWHFTGLGEKVAKWVE